MCCLRLVMIIKLLGMKMTATKTLLNRLFRQMPMVPFVLWPKMWMATETLMLFLVRPEMEKLHGMKMMAIKTLLNRLLPLTRQVF